MTIKNLKEKDATYYWITEQYYHGITSEDSWGKPIKVCRSEEAAKDLIELESTLYAKDLENPEIDREIPRMITVRPNNGEDFYPCMDFWYYKVLLLPNEEDI